MELKLTVQGLLIYFTMLLYLQALVVYRKSSSRPTFIFFTAGFILAAVSVIYRWINVGHIPLKNLFEVFLFMGMLVYPISLISRKVTFNTGYVFDVLMGVILLFPAGFVFDAAPDRLPPVLQSWHFGPHVLSYLVAYLFMIKAAFAAAGQLKAGKENVYERDAFELTRLGYPLLTLCLILGSLWAKKAWGRFWGFDPKEMWSLATWAVYTGGFYFRTRFKNPSQNSMWIIAGAVFIVITLLWVNLSRIFAGLHNYAT